MEYIIYIRINLKTSSKRKYLCFRIVRGYLKKERMKEVEVFGKCKFTDKRLILREYIRNIVSKRESNSD